MLVPPPGERAQAPQPVRTPDVLDAGLERVAAARSRMPLPDSDSVTEPVHPRSGKPIMMPEVPKVDLTGLFPMAKAQKEALESWDRDVEKLAEDYIALHYPDQKLDPKKRAAIADYVRRNPRAALQAITPSRPFGEGKIGAFLDRMTTAGAEIVTGGKVSPHAPLSTGDETMDTVADTIGSIMGYAVPAGVPGQAFQVGNYVSLGIAPKLASKLKLPYGLVENAISKSVGFGLLQAPGEDPVQMVKGAASGLVAGVSQYLAGPTVNALMAKVGKSGTSLERIAEAVHKQGSLFSTHSVLQGIMDKKPAREIAVEGITSYLTGGILGLIQQAYPEAKYRIEVGKQQTQNIMRGVQMLQRMGARPLYDRSGNVIPGAWVSPDGKQVSRIYVDYKGNVYTLDQLVNRPAWQKLIHADLGILPRGITPAGYQIEDVPVPAGFIGAPPSPGAPATQIVPGAPFPPAGPQATVSPSPSPVIPLPAGPSATPPATTSPVPPEPMEQSIEGAKVRYADRLRFWIRAGAPPEREPVPEDIIPKHEAETIKNAVLTSYKAPRLSYEPEAPAEVRPEPAEGIESFPDYLRPAVDKMLDNPYTEGVSYRYEPEPRVENMNREELDRLGYTYLPEGPYARAGTVTTLSNGTRQIIFYAGASKDAVLEETVHVIQKRLEEIDPDLARDIKNWETDVIAKARAEGERIPEGYELFAKAYVYSEMGYAKEEPRLAEMLAIPSHIKTRFDRLIGASKSGADNLSFWRGEDMPKTPAEQRRLYVPERAPTVRTTTDRQEVIKLLERLAEIRGKPKDYKSFVKAFQKESAALQGAIVEKGEERALADLRAELERLEAKPVEPKPEQGAIEADKALAKTEGEEGKPISPETLRTGAPVEEGARGPTEETPAKLKPVKPLATSRTTTIYTEEDVPIEVEYALLEAKDVITSFDAGFPGELQPRDIDRKASEARVESYRARLNPVRMGENFMVSPGAPVVGPDGVVEVGNHRTNGLKRAYKESNDVAKHYRKWLIENAESLGFTKEMVTKADQPIFVRIRRTEVDRVEFAQKGNIPGATEMSSVEIAEQDSLRLTQKHLALFVPHEEGKIDSPENKAFISAFIHGLPDINVPAVVDEPSRSKMFDKDLKSLSDDGIRRIRNAIFAKVYGNTFALVKLAEDTDVNVRNIVNAMVGVSPKLLEIKARVQSGEYYPLDLSEDLAAAMVKLSELRDQKMSVEMYLKQLGMFGEELTDIGKDILVIFDKHKRSAKRIMSVFKQYARGVELTGSPNQKSVFKTAPPTQKELLEFALQKVESEMEASKSEKREAEGQASLLPPEDVGGKGAAAPGRTGTEGTPGPKEGAGPGDALRERVDKTLKNRISDDILSLKKADVSEFRHAPEKTSLRQVASGIKRGINFKILSPGTVNLDLGGGRFDEGTQFLAKHRVENLIYDPYARSRAYNNAVTERLNKEGGADSATLNNVLNVIPSQEDRADVLRFMYQKLKPGGKAIVTIYEGDGSGKGRRLLYRDGTSSWQENRRVDTYRPEIEAALPKDAEVSKRYGMFVVNKPGAQLIEQRLEVKVIDEATLHPVVKRRWEMAKDAYKMANEKVLDRITRDLKDWITKEPPDHRVTPEVAAQANSIIEKASEMAAEIKGVKSKDPQDMTFEEFEILTKNFFAPKVEWFKVESPELRQAQKLIQQLINDAKQGKQLDRKEAEALVDRFGMEIEWGVMGYKASGLGSPGGPSINIAKKYERGPFPTDTFIHEFTHNLLHSKGGFEPWRKKKGEELWRGDWATVARMKQIPRGEAKYWTEQTERYARLGELYFLRNQELKEKAPILYDKYEKLLNDNAYVVARLLFMRDKWGRPFDEIRRQTYNWIQAQSKSDKSLPEIGDKKGSILASLKPAGVNNPANRQVVLVLRGISEAMEVLGDKRRVMAYRRAAEQIGKLDKPITEVELKTIPGVGKSIAEKIDEVLKTGESAYLKELEKQAGPIREIQKKTRELLGLHGGKEEQHIPAARKAAKGGSFTIRKGREKIVGKLVEDVEGGLSKLERSIELGYRPVYEADVLRRLGQPVTPESEKNLIGYLWDEQVWVPLDKDISELTDRDLQLMDRPTNLYARYFKSIYSNLPKDMTDEAVVAQKQMRIFISKHYPVIEKALKGFSDQQVEDVADILEGKAEAKGAEGEAARIIKKDFFDPLFREAVKAGILKPGQYVQNYFSRMREIMANIAGNDRLLRLTDRRSRIEAQLDKAEGAKAERYRKQLEVLNKEIDRIVKHMEKAEQFAALPRPWFVNPRTGEMRGYIKDVRKVAYIYVNALSKRMFVDPVMRKWEPIIRHMPRDRRDMATEFFDDVLGRPSAQERMLNQLIADAFKLIGKDAGHRPSQELSRFMVSLLVQNKLGLGVAQALRNYTQIMLALADVASIKDPMGIFRYAIKAQKILLTKEGQRFVAETCGPLQQRIYHEGLQTVSIYSRWATRLIDKMSKVTMFMFQKSDEYNVKFSYLVGFLSARDQGKSVAEAIEYGNDVAVRTQFPYDPRRAPIYRTPIGKLFGLFTSWSGYFIELNLHWARQGDFGKIILAQLLLMGTAYLSKKLGLILRVGFIDNVTGHILYKAASEEDIVVVSYVKDLQKIVKRLITGDPEEWEKAIAESTYLMPGGEVFRRLHRFIQAAGDNWKVRNAKGEVQFEYSKDDWLSENTGIPWEAVRALFGQTTESIGRREIGGKFDKAILSLIETGNEEAYYKTLNSLAEDARRLNMDAQELFDAAKTRIRQDYYDKVYEALEKGDHKEADRLAKILLNLGATQETIMRAVNNRYQAGLRGFFDELHTALKKGDHKVADRIAKKLRDMGVSKEAIMTEINKRYQAEQ